MTDFESILKQARSLPPEDRIRLIKTLLEECPNSREADEEATAVRGWLMWAESSNEDWSDFYPESLRRKMRREG